MIVKRFALVFLLSSLLFSGMFVAAQESTEEMMTLEPTAVATLSSTLVPTPEVTPEPLPDGEPIPDGEPPVTSPSSFLDQLYSLLNDGTYMAWAAAATVIVVGFFKTLLGAAGISVTGSTAVLFALFIQVVIWVGYAIANYLGQGETFRTGYLTLADIARSLLPLFGAVGLGHEAYQFAHRRNWPVLGYSKPVDRTGSVKD